jgi:hypothetical protein
MKRRVWNEGKWEDFSLIKIKMENEEKIFLNPQNLFSPTCRGSGFFFFLEFDLMKC